MSIKVLPPDVAARIAAGEVIERPSSVVKELVENSLDAGASQITVEVKGGGIELIRVTDNGCGIPADDVELAFHRHATSKISGISDLDSIGTLGFRGEALPSIAAVARMSLVTRPHDASAGREVHLRWGEVVRGGTRGCPPGTSVTVQGLFENLPARRKFLKSPSGEAARISDLVSRYALAFPEVQFRLLVNGRSTLTSPGSGNLADALASVYGAETARAMLEVSWPVLSKVEGPTLSPSLSKAGGEGPGDGYAIKGFISPPSLNRANRSYITFLVNRRWIASPLLSFAFMESYQGFLPERRYPMAVLNLTVPLADVDVNVHPAKREVRFRYEDRVFSALQRSVRASLVATAPVPEMRLSGAPSSEIGAQHTVPLHTSTADRQHSGLAFGLRQAQAQGRPSDASPIEVGAAHGLGTLPAPVEVVPSLRQAQGRPLRILGQVRNTYLVAEGPDGMYLIDQHAAHERVLFEKVSREVSEKTPQMQALLEPVVVELSPGQEEMVQASMGLLERYGFIIEPFGERMYLMRAIPAVVGSAGSSAALRAGPGKTLLEVLDLMAYEGLVKEREEALVASIACHSAVRAGMVLSQQEMEELVRRLESCDNPHTCPHGRPTMIHLSSHHLEREFGRR